MSYILSGTTIRSPHDFNENNSTQYAQQKTLSGNVGRDYYGSNKRIWTLNYQNCNVTDFAIINNLYQTYLSSGTAQAFQVTETNYPVASTNVHIDLLQRGFSIRGSDYLSDFSLILTEA